MRSAAQVARAGAKLRVRMRVRQRQRQRQRLQSLVVVGALLGGLLGAPGRAQASAPELFGFGARTGAMGATGAAHALDYESVYANPAALTRGQNKRLTVGYLFGYFDLGMSQNLRRIRPPKADNTYGLIIGATIPLPFDGWLRNRVWIGMSFYLPTGVVTRARVPLPGQPFFALLESRTQVVGVQVAGAVEPMEGLRLGAGVLALAALTGTVWIDADAAGNIGSTVEQQLIVDYAPIFGVMWTPRWIPRWSFGITYRGQSKAGFDVVLKNNLEDELPVGLPELTISGIAQFDPQQVAVEVAWTPRAGMTVAAQVTWKDWSAYPLPTQNVTAAAAPLPEPGFHDTAVGRLGFEQRLRWGRWSLALRAGYFFEPTPVPEQRGATNLLDNHRHVFTLGLGTDYRSERVTPFTLDLFCQVHVLMPRAHEKDPKRLATADPLLAQYARSRFETWGQLVVAGLQVGVEF